MTGGTNLRAVQSGFAAHFSATGALREGVGRSGRVHLDRWLPFIFLHRGADDEDSLARRIAINSPSYCLWNESDDEASRGALADVVAALADHEGRVLVVTLIDGPILPHVAGSDKLPPFEAVIGAGRHDDAERSAAALEHALAKVEIDLRHCKVDRRGFESRLPAGFDEALDAVQGVARLSLEVPPIHRSAGGAVFPEIRHELVMHMGDALLRTACAFIDDGKREAPKHYRSLGRSAYLAAALKADKRLAAMSASFDFLLSISPIDTARACDEFLAGKAQEAPRFHYRPLSVDPDAAKGELYDIDLAQLEDPLLETLLSEKRREIDAQLTMLATRNTNAFQPASMVLYGTVDAALLESARSILAVPGINPRRGEGVGAERIARAARATIDQYQAQDKRFAATVEVRDDVSGLMVSRDRLMIGSDSAMPANRLDALLAHEVGVHLLTYFNGASQGLGIFASGLAGYEGVQEGLGVFAEWAVGGLTRARMRLLAARVVAVHAMQQGAEFIQCYRMLHHDHGFTPRGAFGIAARVFRSGGLAKDAIYLKGFKSVIDMLAEGRSLAPFWLGKIAKRHVSAIEELLQRGLVHEPIFTPQFLSDDGTKQRIARLRTRSHLSELLND
ncbi:MAG: DUF1704 domain-containing protein [Sphingomonas sp.]|nr:DUF1704 domain-containing protein [Sphingomonas sp.]